MRKMYSEGQVKVLANRKYKHTMTILLDSLTSAVIWFYDNNPTAYDVTSLKAMLAVEGCIPVQSLKGGACSIFYASSLPYFSIIDKTGSVVAEEIESTGTSTVEEA